MLVTDGMESLACHKMGKNFQGFNQNLVSFTVLHVRNDLLSPCCLLCLVFCGSSHKYNLVSLHMFQNDFCSFFGQYNYIYLA